MGRKVYYIDGQDATESEVNNLIATHEEIRNQGLKVRKKRALNGKYYTQTSAYYIDYKTRELKYFCIYEY